MHTLAPPSRTVSRSVLPREMTAVHIPEWVRVLVKTAAVGSVSMVSSMSVTNLRNRVKQAARQGAGELAFCRGLRPVRVAHDHPVKFVVSELVIGSIHKRPTPNSALRACDRLQE